jgi:hypothetical protein
MTKKLSAVNVGVDVIHDAIEQHAAYHHKRDLLTSMPASAPTSLAP